MRTVTERHPDPVRVCFRVTVPNVGPQDMHLFQDYDSLLTSAIRDNVERVSLPSRNDGVIHVCIGASVLIVSSNAAHCRPDRGRLRYPQVEST